jgi:beta-glucosidase
MSASTNSKAIVEKRINELLSHMTIEDKVGQMNQPMRLTENDNISIQQGKIGSSIFAGSAWAGKELPISAQAEFANQYQRIAMTESRLKIPILFARDVIHGHRTVLPIPLAQAASWDPSLIEDAYTIAAKEATADGIKWAFSPMLDIARDPRWGRIAEGYGEDPYLASAMAVAAVRGFQGDDYSHPDRLAACAKHYVGYGAAEGGRDYDKVELSEGTMRDVYMPSFHAAVDAGVATIMSGFHDYNGVPVAASHFLLTNVLRDEWGFKGFVVSDWNAVLELTVHGVAADSGEAATLAVSAGVDMDMVSGVYLNYLAQLVQQGRVPITTIDESVRRILRVKIQTGLFENPYVDPEKAARVMVTPEHREVARRLAQETTVLIKNNANILPLDNRFKRVAVLGPLVEARSELFGCWTLDGKAEDVTPISEATREAAPKDMQIFPLSEHYDAALAYARWADVAIVVVGEHPQRSGEASSISTLDLPAGQRQLIQALYDNRIPIILVVIAGRPLSIGYEANLAEAVLYAWHPGVEGGHAIADLLFGHANPSGKLPVTFPRTVGQVPIYYNRKNTGRPSQMGKFFNGYIDLPSEPLYPFGFGLSYTQFAYANLTIASSSKEQKEISADITNIGDRAGSEIPQLYVRDLVASVTRPVKELKGFQRMALQPGETRRVSFSLSTADLTFTGFENKSIFEPGEFDVWIGPDSTQGLHGKMTF